MIVAGRARRAALRSGEAHHVAPPPRPSPAPHRRPARPGPAPLVLRALGVRRPRGGRGPRGLRRAPPTRTVPRRSETRHRAGPRNPRRPDAVTAPPASRSASRSRSGVPVLLCPPRTRSPSQPRCPPKLGAGLWARGDAGAALPPGRARPRACPVRTSSFHCRHLLCRVCASRLLMEHREGLRHAAVGLRMKNIASDGAFGF